MENLEQLVEEIMREKGVSPKLDEQKFVESAMERFTIHMPEYIKGCLTRSFNEIYEEEMAKAGRSKMCYYFKTKKCPGHTTKYGCLECDLYKPINWKGILKRLWTPWLIAHWSIVIWAGIAFSPLCILGLLFTPIMFAIVYFKLRRR